MNIQQFMTNWASLDVDRKQEIWRFFKTMLKKSKTYYSDPREEEMNKIQIPLIIQRIIAEFELEGKDLGINFREFKARYEDLLENARKQLYIELF